MQNLLLLSWDMSHMQAILPEIFTKEQISQCSRSPKPWRHCSFPKEMSTSIPFDLISRQVYMHPLKMYTYIFIFIINPGMVDTGWFTKINYMIICAYDTRNNNNRHLLIAGRVGVAQRSTRIYLVGDRVEMRNDSSAAGAGVCSLPVSYNALDQKCYSKCQILNNLLGPKVWWVWRSHTASPVS